MRTPVLLFVCMSGTCMLAQPTFQAADLTPAIGTLFTERHCDYRAAGPAIGDFVYDVSDVIMGTPNTTAHLEPATTPYAATYPTATYTRSRSDSPTTLWYYEITPTAMIYLGSRNVNGARIQMDTLRELVFPLSLGTSWSDEFSFQRITFNDTLEYEATFEGVYNGYGTLLLPYGEFSDVARVETTVFYPIIFPTPNPVEYHYVAYYAAGYAFPLFLTAYGLSNTDTIAKGVSMMDPSMLGIAEAKPQITGTLAPNPVNGLTHLTLSTASTFGMEIRVLDATGRVVRILQPSTQERRFAIDMTGIVPGLYFVRVTERSGATGSWPLVVK